MAGLAVVVRLNMSGRFTRDEAVVVTAAARTIHRVVIDTRERIPLHAAAVARRAVVIRSDVLRRFTRCRHHAARRMTTGTGARRAFELAAHVAAFAGQLRVRTFERKSGFEMIEIGCLRASTKQTQFGK